MQTTHQYLFPVEFRGDEVNIAQISATFPPYMSGTGNVCFYNSLELARKGHKVTVFTSRYPDINYDYPDAFEVLRIRPLFRILNSPFLPQILALRGYDLIHLHYPYPFGGELLYLLSKYSGQKYVLTYHNDLIYNGIISPFLSLYHTTLIKHVVQSAQKVCFSSLDFARNTRIYHYIENPEETAIEIPIGIDSSQFNPNINADGLKAEAGLEGKKVILFVGGLDLPHYFKGVDNLLKSYAAVTHDDTHLIIVGDGNLKPSYMDLARKLGIAEKTLFTGSVSSRELPLYYSAADMLVLPSVSTESFGIVLLEAMACAKPVIASSLPGVRTVVDHGKNGYLVEPRNIEELTATITYLLDNEDIARRLGREGRKKVEEKYNWNRIAGQLEAMYTGVISS
jgi:glycosyltransferase involved in cell wall biosynthesis